MTCAVSTSYVLFLLSIRPGRPNAFKKTVYALVCLDHQLVMQVGGILFLLGGFLMFAYQAWSWRKRRETKVGAADKIRQHAGVHVQMMSWFSHNC